MADETTFHTSEASAKRRADPGAYRRIFEDSPDGAALLEALQARFCRKIWHAGGLEGARQTDYANGQFSVINFINAQINIAHGVGDPNDDGSS
jgi:hypothetical protein